jgi:hypothetical protein
MKKLLLVISFGFVILAVGTQSTTFAAEPINGTPINTQNPGWQQMITAPADREKAVQVVGQWINHGIRQLATFSIYIEIRGPHGFAVEMFPNDAQIHKVPPQYSAWVRIADNPGEYGDNDTYWDDPLRFIAGDPF